MCHALDECQRANGGMSHLSNVKCINWMFCRLMSKVDTTNAQYGLWPMDRPSSSSSSSLFNRHSIQFMRLFSRKKNGNISFTCMQCAFHRGVHRAYKRALIYAILHSQTLHIYARHVGRLHHKYWNLTGKIWFSSWSTHGRRPIRLCHHMANGHTQHCSLFTLLAHKPQNIYNMNIYKMQSINNNMRQVHTHSTSHSTQQTNERKQTQNIQFLFTYKHHHHIYRIYNSVNASP